MRGHGEGKAMGTGLVLEGLTVYRGRLRVLEKVSLGLGAGEMVCIAGMNGAGKTTLFQAVMGLCPAAGGRMRYGGRDLGVFLEDLIGEGNVALTLGVTMLSAFEHAAEAQGMLCRTIMNAMEEFIAENAEEAKKSRKMVERINKVADSANELAEELHRKVTVEELMKETGMSRRVIEDAVRMSGNKIEAIAE